jgi:hypothetical protein
MAPATKPVDTSGQSLALQGENASYSIEELKKKHREAKAVRERFIPDWVLNLAFYVGGDLQWCYWNRGRLDRPFIAEWRELVTDNRIQPVILARAAKKVKNRPAFIITPSTSDEGDIDASKIGEKVLEADWTGLGLQKKLFQAILFADITCAGFWKIYWDSTKGDSAEFVYDQNNQPVMTNGAPTRPDAYDNGLPDGLTTQTLAQGDVCVDVLSPFELYPDPIATTLEEAEWVVEEKVRSVEYVKRRYNVDLKADADAPIGPVESRLFSSAVYSQGDTAQYKGVKVFEFWSRPSTEFPSGKRCVWAQDQILLEDDQPLDPMPYVMFSGIRVPNRFWPTSVASQLRGPQVALNKIESQIAQNAERIGNPALMKSREANVHYTGIPGEEILYSSTVQDAVPQYLVPPEVPTYVREQIDRITDSIQEISGMHEVSNATVPAGVTAASAINLLQEADDTRIGPEIQDMETQLAQAGTKILILRATYNSDERLVRIAGEDGNWDIFSFRGQMLHGNTQAEVQAGSAMPRSKAAKQAAMIELLQLMFQYGAELDPRDLRNFLKEYDVGGLDRLFESITTDEMQVQREQRLMSQGTAVDINPWDDDQYHIAAHQDFQKTDRYAQLGPNIQQIFQAHVLAHQERQVQTTNLAVQAQQPQIPGMNGGGNAPPDMGQTQLSTPEGGLASTTIP